MQLYNKKLYQNGNYYYKYTVVTCQANTSLVCTIHFIAYTYNYIMKCPPTLRDKYNSLS